MGQFFLTAVIVLSAVISGFFFNMYRNDRNQFLQFYALTWVFYALGLLSLLLSNIGGPEMLLSLKKLFDMYSVMSMLLAIYKYFHLVIPDYWVRFSLYLIIWQIISI